MRSWQLPVETARAFRIAFRVEGMRKRESLHAAVRLARGLSARAPARGTAERRVLRRAISIVETLLFGGSNCVRRSLMELALDQGAASEPFVAGFRRSGGPRSGHAWLASDGDNGSYDAVVTIS
jgi:hypothetical protein